MNLPEILALKYPGIDFMRDVQLQDHSDGKGPIIGVWNLPEPKPTKEQLAQWAVELQPAYELAQAKLANIPLYKELDNIDLKSIRALRAGDKAQLDKLEAQAIALRAKLVK